MFPSEKLEVYNKAFSANQKVYSFLTINSKISGYLKNQYGRESLSIMLNIAEDSGRLTTIERNIFFVNATGSVFNCFAVVYFLFAQNEVNQEFLHAIKSQYEEISKMLYVLIKNINAD